MSEFLLGRRSQLWILGLVAISALIAANVAWLFPTLEEMDTGAYLLYRAVGVDARNQIASFLNSHEFALKNAADIIAQGTGRETELISRLMKENPPFESVALLGLDGVERFKTHRFLLTTPADLRNRSRDELFKAVSRGEIYRGPALISGISEPLITIALPLRRESGFSAIVADINLKFLLDVVRGITTGDRGVAYIIDRDGYIIAHPNSSLVFGRVNVLERKIITATLSGREADTRNSDFIYKNEKGEDIFAVALPFELTNWALVVEAPKSVALASSRRILSAALISFGLEIVLLLLLIWNYFNLIKTATLFYSERNQREAILNSLSDGVVEYNDKSEIVLMNPKAEELLNVKFKDIRGLAISPDIAKTNPKMKGLVELMYPALAPYASQTREIVGTLAKTMEVHISSPELKLLVTITQVVEESGRVRGFLKILHDVSRERLLGRMKSEFVSIAAHQLRTPLSAIKWTLQLLLDGDAGALSKEQGDFLAKGYEINERMIKLVNDLLSAARIEEGRFGYEFAEVNLSEFLENAIAGYADIAQRKEITFSFKDKAGKLSPIYADAEKLSLAFNNLLDNAVKYTAGSGKIAVTLSREGNFATVSVADTGVGIPTEENKRVFSKFFRASNVIRMETEGTGLGLFIAKNIIRRHGGDISFVSKVGNGTTFTLALPLKKELVPKEEKPELEEFLGSV
ncbi:MAG: PAS/PAC sensor hybrid histidine kinase [Candidatus Giovannonibacteria bacterium GW2011_GWC2_44_9]|uniref:histidine kinase n=3 Tax=Candidatus Giovannoniibacteriota TaxID=1752738 RepID=A0A0G1IVI3_9BACT|nr:MAG: PAS/PAC sensor hybrid histidine kinase [Candidatus Giovannonibacteria bacterium GW2011_GWB1_44_23]KKT63416.1 MAG: PAS/PAC sensor hybrid histidine kinase [Candidatus Giovannonibacteria bacterium GW2011_GWA1_44_29]KKT83715.1 MAG: PAS/PAC sensor hybrid histidine kinase [Candidatus Giovannonibacteria bacterium GW2011_GWC2_44_9]KKT91474.1 MAG: Multi-sensor signal transduction histidine kinase [Parcubacteria group bacterium GW2011_GWC1_45_13]